jgi:hypothetical protein
METSKVFWLVGAVAVVILFFYVLLPKLNLTHQSGMFLRGLLFFSMMGYLAYDFYIKEKYWYILVLVAGSVAFLMLLLAKKSDD